MENILSITYRRCLANLVDLLRGAAAAAARFFLNLLLLAITAFDALFRLQ